MDAEYRVRFPPSPTGQLHVGNVRTALYNWLLARKHGGKLVLRIEDTDVARSTRANEDKLLSDLKWLGLGWDEGPLAGGPHGPYRQSERQAVYSEKLETLLAGGKVYYCFCTPDELQAERSTALAERRPPRYSGRCRGIDPAEARKRIESGEDAAIRFRVEKGASITWDDLIHGPLSFEREVIGDFVIARSNGTPAYNFAVSVDDALMRVTQVLRGDDHISNTPRQILIYRALGFDPPQFGHLPMILGPDGSRLSKRHGATSVDEFRSRGYLPEALVNYLALLGWNPGDEREIFSRDELVEAFSLERVSKSAAVFSVEKLDWLNSNYMRTLPAERILECATPLLKEQGYLPDKPDAGQREWILELVALFAQSSSTLAEMVDGCSLVFDFDPAMSLADAAAADVLGEPGASGVIKALADEITPGEDINSDRFKEIIKAVKAKTGAKGRELFHPIRIAVTGRAAGPELYAIVPLLERGKHLELPKPVLGVIDRVRLMNERLGG